MMTVAGTAFSVFLIVFLVGYLIVRPKGRSGPAIQGDHREQLRYAVELIADGFDYYSDWRMQMICAFDDTIEPQLEDYRAAAERIAPHGRDEWDALIEAELADIFPSEPLKRGNNIRLSRGG